MSAPVIPNVGVPLAEILINATSGSPYRTGRADSASVLPIANLTAPQAAVLIDPVSGAPYRI